MAHPDASIAHVNERDPLITEATELTRLKMAIEFIDTPVARKDGLGGINQLRFDNTMDRAVAALGIKNQVSPDGIFNSSFLPPAASAGCSKRARPIKKPEQSATIPALL